MIDLVLDSHSSQTILSRDRVRHQWNKSTIRGTAGVGVENSTEWTDVNVDAYSNWNCYFNFLTFSFNTFVWVHRHVWAIWKSIFQIAGRAYLRQLKCVRETKINRPKFKIGKVLGLISAEFERLIRFIKIHCHWHWHCSIGLLLQYWQWGLVKDFTALNQSTPNRISNQMTNSILVEFNGTWTFHWLAKFEQ